MFTPERLRSEPHPDFDKAQAFVEELVVKGAFDQPIHPIRLGVMAVEAEVSPVAVDQFVRSAVSADRKLLHDRIGKGIEVSQFTKESQGLVRWMMGCPHPENVAVSGLFRWMAGYTNPEDV